MEVVVWGGVGYCSVVQQACPAGWLGGAEPVRAMLRLVLQQCDPCLGLWHAYVAWKLLWWLAQRWPAGLHCLPHSGACRASSTQCCLLACAAARRRLMHDLRQGGTRGRLEVRSQLLQGSRRLPGVTLLP